MSPPSMRPESVMDNRFIRNFISALTFLTVIPVPQRFLPESENLGESVDYFPFVGLLIGIMAVTLDGFLLVHFPPAIKAVICVLFMEFISKGLHLDGLADTADGFLSSRPKERILEIMRDSRIGTMGAAAIAGIMILKVAAVFSLAGSLRASALIMAPVAGRCSMSVIMSFFEYARKEGGLASVFHKNAGSGKGLMQIAFLLVAGVMVSGLNGFYIAISSVIFVFFWGWCSKRVISGFTGDTLGAGCELTEVFVLMLYAVYS